MTMKTETEERPATATEMAAMSFEPWSLGGIQAAVECRVRQIGPFPFADGKSRLAHAGKDEARTRKNNAGLRR